ncbi:hypothetical protein [Acidilobus sp.]|uniref:hypothetical protein n=1 Tax=Acidilobus sp. TaxID=1872109 RepID=UPI003D02C702
MGGSKEAKHGIEAENILIKYFNEDKDVLRRCTNKLGVQLSESITIIKPNNRIKCDVMIKDILEGATVCISLKTVTNASFHNLDRRWLNEWRSILKMPDEIYAILFESILRKARDPKAIFIHPKDREKIRQFIKNNINIILKEIFTRDEKDLKILMIWNKKGNELCMFSISDVISFLLSNQLSFLMKALSK